MIHLTKNDCDSSSAGTENAPSSFEKLEEAVSYLAYLAKESTTQHYISRTSEGRYSVLVMKETLDNLPAYQQFVGYFKLHENNN